MTRFFPRVGILLLFAVGLASCSSRPRADIAYDPSTFSAPDTQFAQVAQEDYRIGPADILQVNVFEVPELTNTYEVNGLGSINMPLVGEIETKQLTTTEAGKRIERALSAKYFQNPSVTVSLKEVRSQRVTIDGSINAPGIYPVAGNMTLLQAVAMAKGLDANANANRVVVFRTIEGRRAAAAFDLQKVREGLTTDPAIYGNDIIVVDGSRSRQAFRDILRGLPILGLFRWF